jgi:hypothetical protein
MLSQRCFFRCTLLPLFLLVAVGHCRGFQIGEAEKRESAAQAGAHRWFSMPLALEGLPANCTFAPVSAELDFTALLARLKLAGVVDERALRLYRLDAGAGPVEEPWQFLARAQARAKERKLLPGTSLNVSYLGEYPAGQAPAELRVSGQLHWIAQAGVSGSARYRLDFGVPMGGRAVQVPFPPQNLRTFDAENRATPVRWFPGMQIRPQWPLDDAIHVLDFGRLFTRYHLGPAREQASGYRFRRPFLYPVNGPDGICLTELGKPHDPAGTHAHHYSLWIAHANVGGRDFWSERGGLIRHDGFALMEDGPLFCRVVQNARWTAGDSALLREIRQLTFYRSAPDFRLIDVELQFSPAGAEAVTLGQTSFGFLAARVAQSMTVFDGAGEIRNANGDRNEQNAHLKRAAWIDQSGPVAPALWNGLAMLDHPENVNHPTGWHCRNDGWAGAAFNMETPYTIEPGKSLRLRYRIHLHQHDALKGKVASRYAEYAAKPILRWGEPRALETKP